MQINHQPGGFSKDKFTSYLAKMAQAGASDMYLIDSYKPYMRVKEKFVAVDEINLTAFEINKVIEEFADAKDAENIAHRKEVDVNLTISDLRFRLNIFFQQGNIGVVIRRVESNIPSMGDLGLPNIYEEFSMRQKGLLFVSGSSGSGKSTSLAAMVNNRNLKGSGHILTIEDPIEFVHGHGRCLVTQREIGVDTDSYETALKSALRQRADVIVVGEIRDATSLEYAIRFAETGHLCISTLHTNNAPQAISRMANMFPEEERKNILAMLAHNLLGIFAQKLVPTKDDGLQLIVETLKNRGLITRLIVEDKIDEIREMMLKGVDDDVHTFDDELLKLYQKGIISKEILVNEAENPSQMVNKVSLLSIDKKKVENKWQLDKSNCDQF